MIMSMRAGTTNLPLELADNDPPLDGFVIPNVQTAAVTPFIHDSPVFQTAIICN